jgi:L-galactose dehydrogenase/L-glyceraldehyde 3-phosphate reductase
MQMRLLGRTRIKVSEIGFGCGDMGGLMVRGSQAEQERAVAMAVDAGINYFDTAAQYGKGQSEENLGRVLRQLKPKITLATKVKIADSRPNAIKAEIKISLQSSLKRLGRDHVDLLQLHNPLFDSAGIGFLRADEALGEVLSTFEDLQKSGLIRYYGLTGLGETQELLRVIATGQFYTAQTVYNLLNPSAATPLPLHYPGQDYQQMLALMSAVGMAGVGIRIMAGGVFGEPHPIAGLGGFPMGTGSTFEIDRQRANKFRDLIGTYGLTSLPDLATRYALATNGLATVLIGCSDLTHLQAAIAATQAPPLSEELMQAIKNIQSSFIGEPR